MMVCEQIDECPFFNSGEVDSRSVEMLKEVYCRQHPEQCARFMVRQAVGVENVPAGLYPNQTHLVLSIVRGSTAKVG
jgi:hypothetical protein